MPEHKPRLTDSPSHLQSPFRLSDKAPPLTFVGVRLHGKATIACNGSPLSIYEPGFGSFDSFEWGPLPDSEWDRIRFMGYVFLARAMLEELLSRGRFHIDESCTSQLPPWFHNHRGFLVRWFETPLAWELTNLPHDRFEISSADLQTWLCEHFNHMENWSSLEAQREGPKIEAECRKLGLIPGPRWTLYWFQVALVLLILATIAILIVGGLAWLVFSFL